MVEKVPVMGRIPRETSDHTHARTSSRPSGALCVMGRIRGHIAHGHGFQIADVDPKLKRGGADQYIVHGRIALEAILDLLPSLITDRGGVFGRP